jgi:hypothetical protein
LWQVDWLFRKLAALDQEIKLIINKRQVAGFEPQLAANSSTTEQGYVHMNNGAGWKNTNIRKNKQVGKE